MGLLRMPYTTSEIDANFYRLIHQLAGTPEDQGAGERRRARRRPFLSTQRIAPHRGERFPEDSEFMDVQCPGLSTSGFSFLLPDSPDFTALVAAFGGPPDVIYVAAEVLHCTRVLVYPSGVVQRAGDQATRPAYQSSDEERPAPMVLVGCRFTKRLEKRPGGGRPGTAGSGP